MDTVLERLIDRLDCLADTRKIMQQAFEVKAQVAHMQ